MITITWGDIGPGIHKGDLIRPYTLEIEMVCNQSQGSWEASNGWRVQWRDGGSEIQTQSTLKSLTLIYRKGRVNCLRGRCFPESQPDIDLALKEFHEWMHKDPWVSLEAEFFNRSI